MVTQENLGGGIALNRDFDLEIDNTGDIKTIYGIDEVKKDIVYNLNENLQDILGQSKEESTLQEANKIIRDTVSSYSNVDGILGLEIYFLGFGEEYDMRINMIISINDEEKELVVNV